MRQSAPQVLSCENISIKFCIDVRILVYTANSNFQYDQVSLGILGQLQCCDNNLIDCKNKTSIYKQTHEKE